MTRIRQAFTGSEIWFACAETIPEVANREFGALYDAVQRWLPRAGYCYDIRGSSGGWIARKYDGRHATVAGSYRDKFGGENVQSYTLEIDDIGEVSWFEDTVLESLMPLQF